MEQQAVTMVMVPETTWEKVENSLNKVISLLEGKNKEEYENQWIGSEQARKMLGISSRTWQVYRDERRIPFSQTGRKIYVKRGDLERFMKENYIQARS